MYNHANASESSTGSAKRLSSNNPFRSALIQEELTGSKDQQYKQWMQKKIQEESSDDDSNSFSEGDEADDLNFSDVKETAPAPRPRLASRNSDTTV